MGLAGVELPVVFVGIWVRRGATPVESPAWLAFGLDHGIGLNILLCSYPERVL